MTRVSDVLELSEVLCRKALDGTVDKQGDALRDECIKAVMALGMSLAVLGVKMFRSDPTAFGENVAKYVSDTMRKIKDMQEKEEEDEQPSAKKGSAWGVH